MGTRPIRCALVAVAVAGCGGGGGGAPDAPPTLDPPGAVARFAPFAPGSGGAWGDVPFPNDLYLDATGHLALTTLPAGPNADEEMVGMLRDGLATLDGAGLRSNVYLPVDVTDGVALDEASLAGAAALVDLDAPGAPLAADVFWRADLAAIVVVPALGTVLRPGHTYGAYLTRAAQTTDGEPVAADDAFVAVADLATTPADPALAAAQASVRPLLEALPGATRAEVVSATVFRTATFVDDTRRMRDVVAAAPPTVTVDDVLTGAELDAILGVQADDAVPGTCADNLRPQPHATVGAIVHGTIALPSFLSETPNVDGLPTFEADGTPVVKGTHPARFTLSLPDAPDWDDLPVIVFIHGVNRTRLDMVTQIETAARLGAAMIAIDLPYHGHRANRSEAQHDVANELLGTQTPDGFGDSYGLFPATALFHLGGSGGIPGYHPQAMGENLRQAALEVASLVAFVRDGDDAPLEAAVAPTAGLPDTISFRDEVALVTESLGAMVGGVTLAVEPGLGVAYLASPAAGFPDPAMLHSPNYGGLFSTALTGPFDLAARIDVTTPARDTRVDPIVMLFGNVIERGDALAYARQVSDGSLRGGAVPDLLVSMAWGDVWVSNDTQEAYARALALPHATMALPTPPAERLRYVDLDDATWPVRGNLDGGATGAFVVFHPATHAAIRKYADTVNYEPEFPPLVAVTPPRAVFPTQTAAIHELWSELIGGHWAGAPVTLTDPYADADPETGGTPCP